MSADRLTFGLTGPTPMLSEDKEVKQNRISQQPDRSSRRFKPHRPVQTARRSQREQEDPQSIAGEDVAGETRVLASEYHADLSRFRAKVPMEPTKCILCGICVRRCTEATWDSAIGFIGRGVNRRVVLFPERAGTCAICNYCQHVCPTGRISSIGPDPPFPHVDDVLSRRK